MDLLQINKYKKEVITYLALLGIELQKQVLLLCFDQIFVSIQF